MDSIAVTKADMTVSRQEALSPFGLLTQLFTAELARRSTQTIGSYRPMQLAYLEDEEPAAQPTFTEKTLRITGMMCEHCEAAVKGALEKVPGVKEASASHQAGTAKVLLDGEISDEALKNAVEAIGYIVDGVE